MSSTLTRFPGFLTEKTGPQPHRSTLLLTARDKAFVCLSRVFFFILNPPRVFVAKKKL